MRCFISDGLKQPPRTGFCREREGQSRPGARQKKPTKPSQERRKWTGRVGKKKPVLTPHIPSQFNGY